MKERERGGGKKERERKRETEAKKPIKFLLLNKIPIKLKSCFEERERGETTGLIMLLLLFPTNIYWVQAKEVRKYQ